MKKQILSMIIALLLSASIIGCGKEPIEEVTLPDTIVEESDEQNTTSIQQ